MVLPRRPWRVRRDVARNLEPKFTCGSNVSVKEYTSVQPVQLSWPSLGQASLPKRGVCVIAPIM